MGKMTEAGKSAPVKAAKAGKSNPAKKRKAEAEIQKEL